MASSVGQIGILGHAYGMGRRTWLRVFEVEGRHIERLPDIGLADELRFETCEANWIRSQAIERVKPDTRVLRPQINQAVEAGDIETAKRLRKELAKKREAVRQEIRDGGGIVGALNAADAQTYRKTRDLFILCAGFVEIAEREQARESRESFSAAAASTSFHAPEGVSDQAAGLPAV